MVTLVDSSPRAQTSWARPLLRLGLLAAAAGLFWLAAGKTWWGMLLYAPQYPSGLELTASLRGIAGDVKEIDTLNHYIGMMPLGHAARFELSLVPWALPALVILALLSAFVAGWPGWLLRLPLALFPAFFLADLQFWMWYAGNHLDPGAPMNRAIKGFTPIALGGGRIAQFSTYGFLEPGFYMALAGSLLVVAAGFIGLRAPRGGAAP